MKKNHIILSKSILLFSLLMLIYSCGDDYNYTPLAQSIPDNSTGIKIIHTALGTDNGPLRPGTANANGVNFLVNYFSNNLKITSTVVGTGSPLSGIGFGSTFPINNYAIIPAGTQDIKVISPAFTVTTVSPAVTVPEKVRVTETLKTDANTKYSNFLVGYPTYSNFLIKDDFSVATNASMAYFRFVNTIVNTPVGGYDLVVQKTYPATSTSPVKTVDLVSIKGIAYLGGQNIFLPIEPNLSTDTGTYVFALRLSGATTNVTTLTTLIPRPTRIYTVFARGYNGGLNLITGASPSTANLPSVSFYTNR
ncbi:MAG: DUF4397 domain-containing protein [Flavobacterium sp.]|nr:DUF4397 domain-containing protein [Flavobacterium sp.]